MLTLTLIGVGTKSFSLKDFDTERRFYSTWKDLHSKADFSKKLKVKTAAGAVFEADVMQIKQCVFEEIDYIEPEVLTEESLKT